MKRPITQWFAKALVLFLVPGLMGCSKAPEAPGPTADTAIGEAIKAAFYSDPELQNDRVDVTVNNGEVTLAGDVSSDAARLQAFKLASSTAGVKKVNDLMHVKAPGVAQGQSAVQESASRTSPTKSGTKTAQTARTEAPESGKSLETKTASPPAPKVVTIPSGTPIRVQMIDSVDSAKHQIGEKFLASLEAPIVVDSEVVVPKGTDVYVKLMQAKTSGKLTGRSELQLELDHLEFQGKSYELSSSTYQQVGKSRGKDTAKKTAIGAAVGTAIGAIAGGGKGAAIGAGVGAGSGAAVQVLTKGKQVQVPSETKIEFVLEQPVEIRK